MSQTILYNITLTKTCGLADIKSSGQSQWVRNTAILYHTALHSSLVFILMLIVGDSSETMFSLTW